MEYTIQQLAKLSGVTRRTLRYYDQIGLLRPARTTEAGYRIYGPSQVDRLQHILFYRALGLELAEIRAALDDPDFRRLEALQSHLAALEERRQALDALILTVRKALDAEQGGIPMPDHKKFECFKQTLIQENEAAYGPELRARYGGGTIDAANDLFMSRSREEYDAWTALGEEIQEKLEAAVQAGADPAGAEGRALALLHRKWCAFRWPGAAEPRNHAALAELYTEDPRFTACYDKAIPGCAAFLRAAAEALNP